MRILPLVLSPLLAGLLLAATPAAYADDDKPEKRRLTVSATEAATAKAALTQNSAAMQKIVDALKASGVDAKDIQTSSLRVEPRYTRPKEGESPQIDGYRVTNQVQLVARNLDRIGDILDQLVSLGANETGGLSFEATKAETLRDDARKEAVANARRRAELYAKAAGVELGEVLSIDEGGGGDAPQPMMHMARAMKSSVPVERGTQTLSANVTITWALK